MNKHYNKIEHIWNNGNVPLQKYDYSDSSTFPFTLLFNSLLSRYFFMNSMSSADFFQYHFFREIHTGIPSECQTV